MSYNVEQTENTTNSAFKQKIKDLLKLDVLETAMSRDPTTVPVLASGKDRFCIFHWNYEKGEINRAYWSENYKDMELTLAMRDWDALMFKMGVNFHKTKSMVMHSLLGDMKLGEVVV